MSGPLVLAGLVPGRLPAWDLPGLAVRQPVLAGPWDYWKLWADAWSHPGPLVNVEHDMRVRAADVQDLLACPEPLCARAYRVFAVGRGYWFIAAFNVDEECGGRWLAVGEQWADRASLGLVKVAPEARTAVLRREAWRGVEHAVCDAVKGRWHMHWPEVAHAHDYDTEALMKASEFERLCARLRVPCDSFRLPSDEPLVEHAAHWRDERELDSEQRQLAEARAAGRRVLRRAGSKMVELTTAPLRETR